MEEDNTCHVPIYGNYRVNRKTGEIVSAELEYADIPAKAVADFLVGKFGIDPEAVEADGKTR